MAAKRHYSGSYEGVNDRRRQEMEDGGMISEDRSAIANMPQDVMIKEYPKSDDYMNDTDSRMDDTIRGVDRQMGEDKSKRNKHLDPKKV